MEFPTSTEGFIGRRALCCMGYSMLHGVTGNWCEETGSPDRNDANTLKTNWS